jgi:hypothetical protein
VSKRILPFNAQSILNFLNSFTRLEDRLWNAGWMSAWSQHIMIYPAFSNTHAYLQNLFFFVDVRHCFGLQETLAASADVRPILHSKLGASQSFSRKITTRCLLKPIIPIRTYYHSTLRMTDSISPAGCPLITTLLALFFFIDI